MPTDEEWSAEHVEEALAQLRQRHPMLSAHLFRILLKTAMQEVKPPDLTALIARADRIINALRDAT
ncbi:MAG: hypothetical protein U0984_09550 [Prosthecobacter sp.]|nr:hypothetical protein [Prosthecobacter sp.]